MAIVDSIVVGTAGHIDHGKTSLVKALTGIDPDRLKEEQDRGITIDLGFARYDLDGLNVAFVDVPGHERFIRNMLAGVSGIDCVLLVIAADESVMPQTREHFDICRLLGVTNGIVVLTKSDIVDDETIELVRLETADMVKESFLEDAPVISVSALSGEGVENLKDALSLVARELSRRSCTGIPRLSIDRAFSMKGFGTVVTGTQLSGEVYKQMELEVLPAGHQVKVRGLQVHGLDKDLAGAGQRVAVNLTGVEVGELSRGDVLVQPGGLEVSRRLDSTLMLLDNVPPLKNGSRVRFHSGTSEVMARVSLGNSVESGLNESLDVLEPGEEAYVRLRLEKPVAVTRGDRFVLRAYSPTITIAGGSILDPAPKRGRVRSAAGAARLSRLSNRLDIVAPIMSMVEESGFHGLAPSRLTARAGIPRDQIQKVIAKLTKTGSIEYLAQRLVSTIRIRTLRKELVGWVVGFHESRPLEPGLPREEARERFTRRSNSEIFDALLGLLVEDGTLRASHYLAMASYKMSLTDNEEHICQQLSASLKEAGLSPPDLSVVANELKASNDIVDRIAQFLVREHVLVKIDSLVFHADSIRDLMAKMTVIKVELGPNRVEIDVALFKRWFSVSRKYAIPLLGYLDQERVTRRVGNIRVLL